MIDIYSHITDTMQLQTAQRIEHGIGNSEAYSMSVALIGKLSNDGAQAAQTAKFEPYQDTEMRCWLLYQIGDNLWRGDTPRPTPMAKGRAIMFTPTQEKKAKKSLRRLLKRSERRLKRKRNG